MSGANHPLSNGMGFTLWQEQESLAEPDERHAANRHRRTVPGNRATAWRRAGTATLFADWLSVLVSGWSPTWVLLALFLTAALFTQVLSDTATTILLGPVALGMASLLDMSLSRWCSAWPWARWPRS